MLSHHILFLPLADSSKYAPCMCGLDLVETWVENTHNFEVFPSVVLYPGFLHIPVTVACHEIFQSES